jgi:hypothetical protein
MSVIQYQFYLIFFFTAFWGVSQRRVFKNTRKNFLQIICVEKLLQKDDTKKPFFPRVSFITFLGVSRRGEGSKTPQKISETDLAVTFLTSDLPTTGVPFFWSPLNTAQKAQTPLEEAGVDACLLFTKNPRS